MTERELTEKELEQIDLLQSEIYDCISNILGYEPEWDIQWIGELSDAVTDVAVRYFGVKEKEFYPYIESDEKVANT